MRCAALYLPCGGACFLEADVVQNDVLRLACGVAVGHDVSPLAGDGEVGEVDGAVDHEQPTEREVEGEAPCEVAAQIEALVDRVGEEREPLPTSDSSGVDVFGPVDAQTAPDHDEQQREVDPVQPPDGTWVHEPGNRAVCWSARRRAPWRRPRSCRSTCRRPYGSGRWFVDGSGRSFGPVSRCFAGGQIPRGVARPRSISLRGRPGEEAPDPRPRRILRRRHRRRRRSGEAVGR